MFSISVFFFLLVCFFLLVTSYEKLRLSSTDWRGSFEDGNETRFLADREAASRKYDRVGFCRKKKTGEEAEAVIFLLLFYFLREGRYADESATSGRLDWPWRCKDSVIS